MKRELGIARCGLACCLCSENVTCKGCRRDGFMELSWCKDAEWCEVRRCGIDKDIVGCYECEPANCRKGLYADKIKARAFAEFARRYGVDELLDCLERNEKAGIVYHREGIMGDYDEFDDLEELIGFIKTGKKTNDSIIIKPAETDEELCGRGYVHCTSWQEAYRGIVSDRYLDTMTVEATTARARKFPENTLIAKDKDKVVGFAVYGPSRDEDLPDAGEVDAIYILSEYYDRKVGYRLMNEAVSRLKECNTVFLWVFEKNERAIRFYHRYGFEFDGCKKEWNLGGPVTLVRMIKKRE